MTAAVNLANIATGPAFSAYQSSAQSALSAGTTTKITLQTEEFDTNSNFDSTTNYRFTPTVAGYYQLNAGIQFNGSTVGIYAVLFKNGSSYKQGIYIPNSSGMGSPSSVVSSVVYFNGSTDYAEFYAYTGSSIPPIAGIERTYFNGAMVRAA
jgi:hypothetical protein